MNKILNYLLTLVKCLLLLAVFALITYITLFMYKDIGKEITSNLKEFILLLLPYIILVFIYMYTLIGKEEKIIHNLFFNIVNSLCLTSILIICIRAISDKNIIEYYTHGVNINYNYFNDYISFFTIMIYCLIVGHILILVKSKINKKNNNKVDSEKLVNEDEKKELHDNPVNKKEIEVNHEISEPSNQEVNESTNDSNNGTIKITIS